MHRAQNGAVSVAAREAACSRRSSRRATAKEPTADDVKQLLARIQSEYLLLPIERRWSAREDDFVSANDLPRMDEMITAIRRLEDDTSRDAKTKLSGQAMLGLVLARLPGRPLETYTDRTTRKALADCELREQSLREFFGSLAKPGGDADALGGRHERALLGARLPAARLGHDGDGAALGGQGARRHGRQGGERRSRSGTCTAPRCASRGSTTWSTCGSRPTAAACGSSSSTTRAGPRASRSCRRRPRRRSPGTWHRTEPRTAHDFGRGIDADTDTDETLVVAIGTDGGANVTHQLRRHVYFTGSQPRGVWRQHARPRHRAELPRHAAGREHRRLPQDGREVRRRRHGAMLVALHVRPGPGSRVQACRRQARRCTGRTASRSRRRRSSSVDASFPVAMGMLVKGVWHDVWYDTKAAGGAFERAPTTFRNRVSADGSTGFPAEAGRYHLYVSLACPWAHRTLIFRALKGLSDAISVSVVNPYMGAEGWTFETGARVHPGYRERRADSPCHLHARGPRLHRPRHRAGPAGTSGRRRS